MTLKEFFVGKAIGTVVVLLLALFVAYLYKMHPHHYLIFLGTPWGEKYADRRIESFSGEFAEHLDGSRACSVDSDCVAVREFGSCSSGYIGVNASTDIARMRTLVNRIWMYRGYPTNICPVDDNPVPDYSRPVATCVQNACQVEYEFDPDSLVLPEPSFSQFEWSYELFDRDGITHTAISLITRAAGGATTTRAIDEVAGSCNEYPERDPDIYERSTMVICYYAGLGHYYKVVQEGDGFAVKRKVFEEASPDYDPPAEEYETIERF